ncbi:unnamed protein product [Chironomus riparius]|uniref:Uncharacterized protein n=1 Tax=Chironomus riparius TaxID=315576 RepID=A0A9N9S1I2_9DIPT|nr:unnamed protein product [Chironomus riparius]
MNNNCLISRLYSKYITVNSHIHATNKYKEKQFFSDWIIEETKNENCIVYPLDLSSFKSIREFAAHVNENEERLDILIHNAGYSNYFKRAVSTDGIEMTMATNHYGPFLLTHLLIDLMKKTAKKNPVRIVVVASKTHTLSYMDPNNDFHLNPVGHFPPSDLYGNSKFANILFTFECARRLKGSNITCNALHPGVVDTGIWRNMPFPANYLFSVVRVFLKTLEEGIQTILYVALSDEVNGITGRYFRNCRYGVPRSDVNNPDWQKALWDASRRIVKLKANDPSI